MIQLQSVFTNSEVAKLVKARSESQAILIYTVLKKCPKAAGFIVKET